MCADPGVRTPSAPAEIFDYLLTYSLLTMKILQRGICPAPAYRPKAFRIVSKQISAREKCLSDSTRHMFVLQYWTTVCVTVLVKCLCYRPGQMIMLQYWTNVCVTVLDKCLCYRPGQMIMLQYWTNLCVTVVGKCLC